MSKTEDGNPPPDFSAVQPRADSSRDDRTLDDPTITWHPPAPPYQDSFVPGRILESRFRIVKRLGRGGMGDVYEAEDLVLREHVALKTLLPQIATDEHYRARFRREVQLARKVTHPNVCRIFDVFGDTPPSSGNLAQTPAAVPFMTMELLNGQTLAQFLYERPNAPLATTPLELKRRLTVEEALPLVTQMIAALDAAHQVSVVHRDFKPGNVFLAQRAGFSDRRVVVTDFGLARLSQSDSREGTSLTSFNEPVGTPLYMAPEQVEGGEVTPATDIYALGIVLYEMMTAAWPFLGKNPRETASLRLKTNPKPPKSIVPTLDANWSAVILKCLEREPADRFSSVRDVLDALAGQKSSLRLSTRAQRENTKKNLQIGAAFIALLLAALSAYRFWPRGPMSTSGIASAAVVRFQNSSQKSEKDWIGTSLAETLTRELAASDRLRVIPGDDVARMRQELDVPTGGELDKSKLDQIRTNLEADYLLLGYYELSGDPKDQQIRATVRIVDPGQSSSTQTVTDTGHESDLFSLSDRLAHSLRGRLNAGEISDAARAEIRAALPTSNAASRAYFDGLEKLRQFDALAATGFFADAVHDDPGSPLPHLALSRAWQTLGHDEQALAEARLAQQASQQLSKPEQSQIECRVLQLRRADWDDAIGACRGLWVLRKTLEDGLSLADVQFTAERWKDALATLATMRAELRTPEKNDPRIDLAEATYQEALTQYSEMQRAAQTAGEKAKNQNASLFQAQALLWLCVAQQNLDQLPSAQAACQDANDIFHTVGDRISEARARTGLANVFSKLKQTDQAARQYEKALELATSAGSAHDRCEALMNYASFFVDTNRPDMAVQRYRQSIKVGQESGNRGCQGRALEGLAIIDSNKRDFDQARSLFERSAKIFSDLNMNADAARSQSNVGKLLLQQGDLNAAAFRFEDAAARRRALGLRDGLSITLSNLGDVRLAQDQPEVALAHYREAQSIESDLGEKDYAEQTNISIATALVAAGKPVDAEDVATKTAKWCATKGDVENEVAARDVVVHALLAQQREADAVAAANELKPLVKPTMDPDIQLSARITVARALATQRKTAPQALTELHDISAEAHQKSLLSHEFEARLALAEGIKLQGKQVNVKSLNEVAARAKSHGFVLLARKLSTLAANP